MGDTSDSEYSYIITERDFVSMLIDLYRNHPELWKLKHPGYLCKLKRAHAFDEIVKELQSYRPEFNEEEAKRKINILRTNFNKERRKVAEARQKGEEYRPALWYYNELLFLSEQEEYQSGSRKSIDTEDNTTKHTYGLQSDGNHDSPPAKRTLPQQTSRSHKKILVKKRKINLEEEEEEKESDQPEQYMTVTTTYYKKPLTKEDILAKNWAMKLKKLSEEQKLFAEKIINDVLFEGELGNLTKDGVSFGSST